MLAEGYLGTERSPLFVASSDITVRAMRFINDDTGTGTYEMSVFLKRNNGDSRPMFPHNTMVGVEGGIEDSQRWDLNPGDQIEGYANVSGVIHYWIF